MIASLLYCVQAEMFDEILKKMKNPKNNDLAIGVCGWVHKNLAGVIFD
jgi:hypothetical protein